MKTCTRCKESKPNNNEYFAKNKACKDGLNPICKQCIKEYNKKYYQTNSDKVKENVKEHASKNKESIKDYQREYYQTNKDILRKKNDKWASEHRDKMAEYRRNWKKRNPNSDKDYYENNKDDVLKRNSLYRSKHVEKMRFYKKKWKVKNREKLYQSARIRQLNKSKGNYSLDEWEQAKVYFDNKCAYCGASSDVLSQDHFIPLSKGGSYTKDNIIPACISCNSSKSDTDFKEWFTKQEFYNFDRLQKIENYLKEIK